MRAEQTGAVCTEAKTIIDKGGCFKPSNTLTRVIVNPRHRRFRYFFFNFRFADIFWKKSNSLTFSGKKSNSTAIRMHCECIVTLDLYISDLVSIFGSLSDVLGGKSNWHNEDSLSLWNTFNTPFKSLSLMLSPTIIPNIITLLRILTIIPLF